MIPEVGVNDVAKIFDMSPSTIKKYYLAIEEHGFRFRRNQQGNVMFNERDVLLLRKLIQLKNQRGVTIKQAAEKLTAAMTDMTIYVEPEETSPSDVTVMTEQINELKDMLAAVQAELQSIKAEQQTSRKLLEARQDEPTLKEVMEQTNKMFKDVLDQIAASNEKKGFWSRIFK